MITQETQKITEKMNNKRKKITGASFIIACVCCDWLVLVCQYPTNADFVGRFSGNQTCGKNDRRSTEKYANQAVDDSNVTINVYPEVSVNADGKTGNIWIQNLPTNRYGQQAILSMKDSKETLYETGLLEPGYEVTELTLAKELTTGTHPGVVELEFYDLENKKLMGKTTVDVTINVNQ
ncbi:hypothetical protein SNF32_05765 [Enterococcus mundtii]|nr:hypothetical protein [Enterococcus mundtii]